MRVDRRLIAHMIPRSDYVSTTFPDDIDDDEEVYVIAMDFFLNDVGM